MKMVPGQELFRWIAKTGIPFDKTDPGFLTLMPTRTFARFWVLPTDPTVWPFFIATLPAGTNMESRNPTMRVCATLFFEALAFRADFPGRSGLSGMKRIPSSPSFSSI